MDTPESNHPIMWDKFRIFSFHAPLDYYLIQSWLSKRNLEVWPKEDLPEMGYVISYYSCPIAIGFLRKCEKNIGILDSLIGDPECDFKLRDQAIDELVQVLISSAKRLKMNRIIAFSNHSRILKRSQKHGFQIQNQTLLSLSLSQGDSLCHS